MKKIFNWFKKLIRIVDSYDKAMSNIDNHLSSINKNLSRYEMKIHEGVQIIKERTDINLDINPSTYGYSQIIMVGKYKNKDYVRIFSVDSSEFEQLLTLVKDMERHGKVRHVDAPYAMNAVLDRKFYY